MNDQDLIQRNQAAILAALGILLVDSGNHEAAMRLNNMAKQTCAYVKAKLNKTPLPTMREAAKATEANPWPDDLEKPL